MRFALRSARPAATVRLAALCLAWLAGTAAMGPASSQEAIPFEHLTAAQGLSQGNVNCIFQDSYGFMWFGTQDGLNRFDGYEFEVYRNDPSDATTITDNFILSIAEDSGGTIWVGTLNAPDLLNRFDRATESFLRVPRDSVGPGAVREGSTFPAYTDPAGYRWSGSGSRGGGLTRLDPRTGAKTVFRHDPSDRESLIDDRVYSVAADRSGAIWVGTRGGLDRLDPRSGKFTHFRHDDRDPGSLSDNFVWPLLADSDGRIWIGTYEGGLNRYDPETNAFHHFRHDETNPRSLAGDVVQSLWQDASGMIWVGLGGQGVDRFHPGLLNFSHYLHDPSNRRSIADNNIQSLFVDRAGIVWISTRDGLNRWNRRTGEFRLYPHRPGDPRSLGDNSIQPMYEDRAGNFWIGLEHRGLDLLDRETGTFRHFTSRPGDPRSLPDNGVTAIMEDRRGELWVGTYNGHLSRLDRATGGFTTIAHDPSNPASIEGSSVYALVEDGDGIIWVGTFGGGLDRFDRGSGTFVHHRHSDEDTGSIADDGVVTMLEDTRGQIWVGTLGGLSRLDRATGKFRTYREKDGLPNDVILGILEDAAGHLWMSTNKGISRFDPAKGEFRNFNYSDGLQGDEFLQFAAARDGRTGELFFGGANGFNVFDPARIRTNPFVPPVVFSSFTRYNSDDEEGKPIAEPGIDVKHAITLSYKDNVANFEFAALSYFNNSKNQYAYRLEGYGDSWIQLGPERRATFTNLDGGDYVLQVRGSNSDGVWNEAGASLSITVTPPWWKTRWAYGSYILLTVAILYALRREEINRREQKAKVREAQLHAKAVEAEKRALEAENARKTKELEDARSLQLSMLPRELPKVPGYEIAVFMKTSTEVGGDYYDFSVAPDGSLNVAFGDATGHGMQAGTIVTLMKGLFISEASKFEIQKFFNHCSRAIKEIRLGRLFMALTLVRFNGKSVSLSSAGMPPAYLYRRSDGTIEEILLKAVPLGSMKNFPYGLLETHMETGDTLLLMTDGLPEQKNAGQEMFDYARVTDCFRSVAEAEPEAIIARLMKEADAWMDGVALDDDITLMIVRRTATGGPPAAA